MDYGRTIYDNTPKVWHGDDPFVGVTITEFSDKYVVRKETIYELDEDVAISTSEPVATILKGEEITWTIKALR